ncbi:FCD domain-containing protein [Microvirga pakistanensis]|uniref:FCD domain-containing protein n=1 Tax=Microvirga pakistanensis TaxID=1682650 RepID=UPI003CC7EDFA
MLTSAVSNKPYKEPTGTRDPGAPLSKSALPITSPFILAAISALPERERGDALQDKLTRTIAAFQSTSLPLQSATASAEGSHLSWRAFWLDAAELAACRACGLESALGAEIVDRMVQCLEAGGIPCNEQRAFLRVVLYAADRRWDATFDTLWKASSTALRLTAHRKGSQQAVISAVESILHAFDRGSPDHARQAMGAYLDLFVPADPVPR